MRTLQDRIAECMRRSPDLSQADIARATGVKTPSVADWLNGKTKSLRPEPARRGALLFGCDQNWLSTGTGSPNWREPQHPSGGTDSSGSLAQDLSDPLPMIDIPSIEWESIKMPAAAVHRMFMLKVKDDAMSSLGGGGLEPGDFAVFDRERPPRPGRDQGPVWLMVFDDPHVTPSRPRGGFFVPGMGAMKYFRTFVRRPY